MFERLRSLFQRTLATVSPAQRRLFASQQDLAKELRALLNAYERRIEYLQSHLIQQSAEDTEADRDIFEEAHQGLTRITIRLRFADQEAEELLQEWRTWLDQENSITISREATERLEMLRSELALRGLLPERHTTQIKQQQKPSTRPAYQPTALSEDTLSAFDEVMKPRFSQEKRWLDQAWRQAMSIGARDAWKAWLTRKRKQVWGWEKRFR
ncbi:hypothetical protein KBB27_02930 [Patescibacteria group bacterium]|nr:hypothetical protein [Patescibacteria group bacterium]